MAAIGPYSQSTNYTHMFNFSDLRGNLPTKKYNTNSISDIINKTPRFSKYNKILKLSQYDNIYDDPQANFTLFVVSDDILNKNVDTIFSELDILTARYIIKGSTLERKIPIEIFKTSNAAYYSTGTKQSRLLITTDGNNVYIDNNAMILQSNINASNGIIHVIDKLIYPE